MAQPVWISPPGELGTYPEGKFFQLPVRAFDPDGGQVFYRLIAGELPAGVQVSKTGLIEGIPQAIASIQGVPAEVGADVISKFTVRAYTELLGGAIGRINDRTFSLTITGQDIPDFVTPSGNIGTYYDGDQVAITIQTTDADPNDAVTFSIAGGELPPGLDIDTHTGVISGTILPLVGPPDTAKAGYDATNYDEYPFDFSTRSASKNFQFTVEISDGKDSNLRVFEIYVYSKDSMTGDTTDFTADNTFITADEVPTRTPVLLNTPGTIGPVRHANWFAYKFNGLDLDGDAIEYSLIAGANVGYDADGTVFDEDDLGFDYGGFNLPPGLSLDPETGWLYGNLPSIGATSATYNFAVRVRKANQPTVVSPYYYFDLELIGDVENTVQWLTDGNLGSINNGDLSYFVIRAQADSDRVLQYRLKPGNYSIQEPGGAGVYNKLPQGLKLLSSGNISGRVSFNGFSLDNGTTTFDKDLKTRLVVDETTFDSKFTFTVNAYSDDGLISVFKTFTIFVNMTYDRPYVGLYIKAMPPQNDRDSVNDLLLDQTIIPAEFLYRPDDPYFGRATSVKYAHAFGLNPASLQSYYSSLYENHYRKTLVLGEIKTARALDAAGNVLYEVVYSEVQDNLVNNQGISVSKEVKLNYPVNAGDSTEISSVFPNSLDNMRNQVIDTVGQLVPGLPLWMTSKQANGKVLGLVPAWVICYTVPGRSEQVAYNIRRYSTLALNSIDFIVDRYELEGQVTRWWNNFEDDGSTVISPYGEWDRPRDMTTFDRTGRPSGLNYIGEVDYATNLAFVDINQRPLSYIASLGGIDGDVGTTVIGKKLIFAKQEGFSDMTPDEAFTNYQYPYDIVTRTAPNQVGAWASFDLNGQPYDFVPYETQQNIILSGSPDPLDGTPGTFDAVAFDYATVIPVPDNQRLAIYTITQNPITGCIVLVHTTDVEINDYVRITRGQEYRNVELFVPYTSPTGLIRSWEPVPESVTAETTFDAGSMRFDRPVDVYEYTDKYDKYLVFPYTTILG